MLKRAAGLTIVAVLLAGCTETATTPTPSIAVSLTPRPGPIGLAPAGSAPVIAHESLDAGWVLGAAAIEVDGVAHLWAVTFSTDEADPPNIRHLTSADARTWTADEDRVHLDATALGLNEIGPVPASVLVEEDGTWLLYGGGRTAEDDEPVVWRAVAPGPEGPWTMHPEPVLTPSAEGWDDAITDHPSVLRTDDGYLMAYGGASGARPNRNRIGMAHSSDGITWTRGPATLPEADDAEALGPAACEIEARTMFEPALIPIETGFRLLFGAIVDDDMVIGAADSPDGRTWTCAAEGPLLGPADFGGPGTGLHSYVVVRDSPDGAVLVEVLADGSSDLWLALPDGG